MTDILRAQQMLESLKRDFKMAWDHPGQYSMDKIDLRSYSKKWNVSSQDLEAYCQTLTLLVPTYPVCIKCGQEWKSLQRKAVPINNGHIIDWVDSFTQWCGNEEHGVLWYFQTKNGICSFNWEVDNLFGRELNNYEVRYDL